MAGDPTHILRALSDPGRRRLYERLYREGEATVGALMRDTDLTQSAVSQQIRMFVDCGLVVGRHDGPRTFYRAVDNGLRPVTDWLNALIRRPAFDAHATIAMFRGDPHP